MTFNRSIKITYSSNAKFTMITRKNGIISKAIIHHSIIVRLFAVKNTKIQQYVKYKCISFFPHKISNNAYQVTEKTV